MPRSYRVTANLAPIRHLTIPGTTSSATLGSWTGASLVAQIDQGRPVAAEIAWQGGGAHFVAITGYSESADSPPQYSVYVQDPGWGSGSYYSLGQFAKAYDSSGTWVASCLSAQEP